MKSFPRLRPSRPARLLPLLLVAVSAFALTPTEWRHRQSLAVAAPGLVRVELSPATFDAAGPQQEDLRVIDRTGREIALLLDRPPAIAARDSEPRSLDVKLAPGATILTLATGTDAPLVAVTLTTPHPFFLKSARVEISADRELWTTLDDGVPLFRQWGAEKLQLDLGHRAAAFVRITISDRRGPSVPFTGAHLSVAAAPAPAPVPVGARTTRREEFSNETVLTLELDGRHMPLAALEFDSAEPLFMRRVTVAVREVRDAVPGERTVGSGTIYRVALDGAPARTQLSLPLNFTPATRELLVHIHNADSPPLALGEVRALRQPLNLLFLAPAAGTYSLLSGNPQAASPRYDLAAFAGELRTAIAATAIPGALENTPDYRPRDSLAPAPLPDVPLPGAPLDAKDWPWRREIVLTRPGVQELELDPAALAQSQGGFADLRLLRAGNQIPYVLEQPALSRALVIAPVATPDPKRPAVSVWQLHLPQAGLPLRRLVLTSSTPLFRREFRLYEKLPGRDGRPREDTLASGTWSRAPEPGAPENRVFDLSARPRTDTLWLETDNGDNPAIALGAVQAIYPVVRLIFKTAETDGFTLAYGNKTAATPRYDLSLVAEKLLTSSRTPARLAAAGPAPAASNPLAGLNGGAIFWAALALVVIVLLVVVAKLLPKPPAGK